MSASGPTRIYMNGLSCRVSEKPGNGRITRKIDIGLINEKNILNILKTFLNNTKFDTSSQVPGGQSGSNFEKHTFLLQIKILWTKTRKFFT